MPALFQEIQERFETEEKGGQQKITQIENLKKDIALEEQQKAELENHIRAKKSALHDLQK